MDWRLKALAFRALELPGGDQAHFFLQRRITKNWPRRAVTLDALAGIARQVTLDYAKYVGGTPASALEIGAGRDLAVPLALRKLGVGKVIAVDLGRLAKIDLIQHAARRLLDGSVDIQDWDDLERFGIAYRAPHRVASRDDKVDCSCSNEVLEHVPLDQLVELLAALRSVTTGITVHSIDYSDHYARSDGGLSRFNFLRYSDEEWRRYNPPRQYVNRLRHGDYLKLFREAGFKIVYEASTPGNPPDKIVRNLATQFKGYQYDDLFALKGRIVAI